MIYDFQVLKTVDTDEDKVRAQVDRRLAGEGSTATLEFKDAALTVPIPEGLFLVEGLQIIKRGIANDVFKFVPRLLSLTFLERFNNQKPIPKKEEAKAPQIKEAAPAPKPRRKKTKAPSQSA